MPIKKGFDPIPPERIRPKPHLRILAQHNLTRQFAYEQRSMALRITEDAHDAIKQMSDVWGIGIPVYIAYAVMAQLERDCGFQTKWLEPSTTERAIASEFPDVKPTATSAPATTPSAAFDPLSAL